MTGTLEGPPIRLHPRDRTATRSKCWRSDCRERFGPYRTIAVLVGGRATVAFCHRRIHDEQGADVDRWKHGS